MRWMRLLLHQLPRDLRKNLVIKFVAVILGACPLNNGALGARSPAKFYAFIVIFTLSPIRLDGEHPRRLPPPASPRASTISSVSRGHAHSALGHWLIPFGGLERKNRVVLPPDRQARVRRFMARKRVNFERVSASPS